MQVLKRGNRGLEPVDFGKITDRIKHLCNGLKVDHNLIVQYVIPKVYDRIPTKKLDEIAAEYAYNKKKDHVDYGKLAAKIFLSNMHKESAPTFTQNMKFLNEHTKMIAPWFMQFLDAWGSKIDAMVVQDRDNFYSYQGLLTLCQNYLFKYEIDDVKKDKDNGNDNEKGKGKNKIEVVYDRPQYYHLRVAIQLKAPTEAEIKARPELLTDEAAIQPYLHRIKRHYRQHSLHLGTHATPTIYNACTIVAQMISCFLLGTGDSVEGIMKNATACAEISKRAGGLGGHYHCIRPRGSRISSTNGKSMGLCNQIKILNEIVFCFNQGGKRNGSMALYLEPWHGEIQDFIAMKRPDGAETERARRLFYAGWIPDLFVKAVIENKPWYLFSEHTCPGLSDTYGAEFEKLYNKYVEEGKYIDKVSAVDIHVEMMKSQVETGAFFICFKDHVNRKSNQKNIGTVKSSNLCTEIMQPSGPDRYAVCCLASIRLQSFLKSVNGKLIYDYEALHDYAQDVARNLDDVLERNDYPRLEAKLSAMETRAIGIGVQGLADVFMAMRIPYLSPEAAEIDVRIFETIYHGALTASADMAEEKGPYPFFKGSPASQGLLQFDLWAMDKEVLGKSFGAAPMPGFYDWDALKARIMKVGLRNSLVTALMPTATTSILLGSTEMHEPIGTNLGTRDTLSGKIIVINDYLIRHLSELNLWDDGMYNKLVLHRGSVQHIKEIPAEVREIYKTVWELPQKDILLRAAQRGSFIDQSQSLNLYFEGEGEEISAKLKGAFVYAWKIGLKTGLYYLHTRPSVDPRLVGTSELKKIDIKPEPKADPKPEPESNPEEGPKPCAWKRGMKPEDCFVCGS